MQDRVLDAADVLVAGIQWLLPASTMDEFAVRVAGSTQ